MFLKIIRQKLADVNRFHKYLLYAVGEVLIILTGILFALQINNWNETRKKSQELNNILVEIFKDLNNDLPIAREHYYNIEDKIALIDSVTRHKIEIETLYNCYMCTSAHAWYSNISFKNRGYKLLGTFSSTNEVLKDSLVQEVLTFYNYFNDWHKRLTKVIVEDIWATRQYQLGNIDFTLDEWIQITNDFTTSKEITKKFMNDEENLKRMVFHKGILIVYNQAINFYVTEGEILKNKLVNRIYSE